VLSLVRLAEGKTHAAMAAIDAAISAETRDLWTRTRLLPAQVEIAIAAGNVAKARTAAEELTRLAESYTSPAMAATTDEAWGRTLVAERDFQGAQKRLRGAVGQWRKIGLPYEIARSRALLGTALIGGGDADGGELELRAARDEFNRLGARLDVARAQKALDAEQERRLGPVQVTRTFMFTDIEASTRLAEVLGNERWEQLLAWHDETIRTLVARHGGDVVNSTGDGFFVAFESPIEAVECARQIQQALAEHRRQTFSPLSVRIGLHGAEANRRGSDFSGVGVHVAARVAALAAGGQIVATASTVAALDGVTTTDEREETLKGVDRTVAVVTVAWS
jgi:class 3 adenylate cyclase